MTITVKELIQGYQNIEKLIEDMYACAKQENWDRFQLLQENLNAFVLRDDLFTLLSNLEPTEASKVTELIINTQSRLKTIYPLIQTSISQVSLQLGNVNVQRKLEQTYSEF